MAFRTFLARILLAFALLGVISAPVFAPVPAVAAHTSATAMADDMPCCPPEAPAVPDCYKSCPLLTVCAAKCFQISASAGGALLSPGHAALILPADDLVPAALPQTPPARPPRILS